VLLDVIKAKISS